MYEDDWAVLCLIYRFCCRLGMQDRRARMGELVVKCITQSLRDMYVIPHSSGVVD